MKKKIILIASIILAILLIGIGVTYGIHMHKENNRVYSVITIDVNPSLKLSLNKDDKVLKVEALNKDAEIIEEKDLKGKEINKALDVVVDKLEENGYLKEEGTILINVESKKKELKSIVETEVKKVTEEKVEVVVQEIEVTEEIKKIAEENNISESKAAYVLEQIKDVEEIDIKDVVDKNIEEVKVVVEEKKEEIKKVEEEKAAEEKKEEEKKEEQITKPVQPTTPTQPSTPKPSTTVTCTPPSDIKSVEWCTWNVKRPQSCEYFYPGEKTKSSSELDARYGGGYGNTLGGYSTTTEYKGASYCHANKTVYTTKTYRYTAYWDSVTGELLKETKEAVPNFISEESIKQSAIKLFGLNEADIVMIWVSTGTEAEGGPNWYYRHQVNIEMPEKKMYTADYNAVTGKLVSKRVWENVIR